MDCDGTGQGDRALRHVLGGLERAEDDAFRRHLPDCAGCRRRVAELRGIDAELALAEREERAVIAATGNVVTRADVEIDVTDAEAPPRPRLRTRIRQWWTSDRAIAGVLAVAAVAVVGLAFWNLHLRDRDALLSTVIEVREAVLADLAVAVPLEADLHRDVAGQGGYVPGVDGEEARVVVLLNGVSAEPGEQVLVWFTTIDGTVIGTPKAFPAIGLPADGLLAFSHHVPQTAAAVVLSIESAPIDVLRPTGRVLLEAMLPGA